LSKIKDVAEIPFQRARSEQAKDSRSEAILRSARELAEQAGVRDVTLTEIAAGVGMHKSSMLRYFETREEIFLRLAASAWVDWAGAVTSDLEILRTTDLRSKDAPDAVAQVLSATLVSRPLFCDLLAHVPLNLERGVSVPKVKEFKVIAISSASEVADGIRTIVDLDPDQARDIVATATAMAGALWQMAAPGTKLRELYETDPELAHAAIDVEPRLTRILSGLINGFLEKTSVT